MRREVRCDNSRSVLPIVGYHIQQIVNELLMRPAGVPDDNDEADVAGENTEDESIQDPAPQDVSVQTILISTGVKATQVASKLKSRGRYS